MHANELKNNIGDNSYVKKVFSGMFEIFIPEILSQCSGENLFCYVDPYGVKVLKYDIFKDIAKCPTCNTVEILVNFNSFGFIRWACAVMKIALDKEIQAEEILEEQNPVNEDDKQSENIYHLNEVMGGDAWQKIIGRYQKRQINGYQAEEEIAQFYKDQLRKIFKYVINLPIQYKEGAHPKYRMFHATNHKDGCNLMAESMQNRKELLKQINRQEGQLDLFKENDLQQGLSIRQELLSIISISKCQLADITALYYTNFGIRDNLIDEIKQMEKDEIISVERDPEETPTGRLSSFWAEETKKKVFISKIN